MIDMFPITSILISPIFLRSRVLILVLCMLKSPRLVILKLFEVKLFPLRDIPDKPELSHEVDAALVF